MGRTINSVLLGGLLSALLGVLPHAMSAERPNVNCYYPAFLWNDCQRELRWGNVASSKRVDATDSDVRQQKSKKGKAGETHQEPKQEKGKASAIA